MIISIGFDIKKFRLRITKNNLAPIIPEIRQIKERLEISWESKFNLLASFSSKKYVVKNAIARKKP
jgi:hypothetical protein